MEGYERVAIDTGGTFTDCVALRDGKLIALKVFSTPEKPAQAVLDGLRAVGAADSVVVRHGTTVGTNAMLERKGARVAFVTTAGFEDTIAIGRQARAKLYDWFQPPPACLVPASCASASRSGQRRMANSCARPTSAALRGCAETIRESGAEAVAVSLLFSFANPENERAVAAALASLGLPLSVSHRILPEFREYERASTVVSNAYLARARWAATLRSLRRA